MRLSAGSRASTSNDIYIQFSQYYSPQSSAIIAIGWGVFLVALIWIKFLDFSGIFLQQKRGFLRLMVEAALWLLDIDGNQLLIVDEPDVDWCQRQLMLLYIILQEKEYDIPRFYQ